MFEALLSLLPGGLTLWLLGAGAIGVLALIWWARRSGRLAERAKQNAARHRARDIADEVDDDVAGRTPKENRKRLKRWVRGAKP